jgi:hypothetical protein
LQNEKRRKSEKNMWTTSLVPLQFFSFCFLEKWRSSTCFSLFFHLFPFYKIIINWEHITLFNLTLKLYQKSHFSVCFLTFICFLHQSVIIVFIVSILLTVSFFLTYFLVDTLIIPFICCIGWRLNNHLNDPQFTGSNYWKMSSLNILLD